MINGASIMATHAPGSSNVVLTIMGVHGSKFTD